MCPHGVRVRRVIGEIADVVAVAEEDTAAVMVPMAEFVSQ